MQLELEKGGGRVTFFEVPPQVIDDLYDDNARRISFFDKKDRIVTMKTASLEHGMATAIVDLMVSKALKRSGMERAMAPTGQATAPYLALRRRSRSVSGKQPDAAYQLRPRYREGEPLADWPQIVIETGRSENDRDLRADLKRWINMGDNAVRLVLLVNVTTTLLKVTAYMPGTQPGRVGHGGEITARRRGDRFRVRAGARIRLPFVNLFFREMRPGEREFELWGSDLEEASASLVEALSDLSDQHRQRPQKHLKASLAQVELDQTFSVDTLPDKKKRKKEVTSPRPR